MITQQEDFIILTQKCNYSATHKAAVPGPKDRHIWADPWEKGVLCDQFVQGVATSTCDLTKTLVCMRGSPIICVISV